jgi:hypothetical protein
MPEETTAVAAVAEVTAGAAAAVEKPKSTAVLIGKQHDITPFCSSDATRYVLRGAHYNKAGKYLEATDGKVLVRVPVCTSAVEEFPSTSAGGNDLDDDIIIPEETLRKALNNIPKGMNIECLNYAKVSTAPAKLTPSIKQVTFVTTDLENEQSVSGKCIEGQFPKTDVIWPKEKPKFKVALASEILQRIAAYATKVGKNGNKPGDPVAITFSFYDTDGLSPVGFSFPVKNGLCDGDKVEGIAMPMRMS